MGFESAAVTVMLTVAVADPEVEPGAAGARLTGSAWSFSTVLILDALLQSLY